MPAWLNKQDIRYTLHNIFVLQIGNYQPDDISQSNEETAR